MKTIKGDLILKKDMVFNESITVEGNIICEFELFNLTVKGDINAGDINAWGINAWDINAGDINAWDINAGDINAWGINAWDINAGDINAGDINAWDINALNINARNINYYAVCFAYKDIMCKSIKGRREKSKHFVIDGKIEVQEK